MKWATVFWDMEIDVEYAFHPATPHQEQYIEVEYINGGNPNEFCYRHDCELGDLEAQLMEEIFA